MDGKEISASGFWIFSVTSQRKITQPRNFDNSILNLILQVELGPAPLLWEIGNNALRPIVYFMTNPAVWDGFANLFCRKKHQLVNEDEEEAELPLAPVTTV